MHLRHPPIQNESNVSVDWKSLQIFLFKKKNSRIKLKIIHKIYVIVILSTCAWATKEAL